MPIRDLLPRMAAKNLLLGGGIFLVLGGLLAAASAIDPAVARLGHVPPASSAFAGASLIIGADALLCAGLAATARPRLQFVSNAALALLAGGICVGAWIATPVSVDPTTELAVGGGLVAGAFPVLVMERSFVASRATDLAFLLRVPLLALLGVGISDLLLASGFGWSVWIAHAVGAVTVLVSTELLLRSFITLFQPPPTGPVPSIARSTVSCAIRLARPSARGLGVALEQQTGLDLQRSWAIGFVARASLPVAVAIVLLGWGLTGLTALGIGQRAVYERLGAPVAVFGPGLHLHLPWPFGSLRQVEFGSMHDVPVTFETVPPSAGSRVDAEDEPPVSADRLWDGTHPAETTYLIASDENGRQGFQVVDLDLRLIWRIGLTDENALDSVTNDVDPGALVRHIAGQILVRNFARRSLSGLLSADRQTIAAELRQSIQQELDRLRTGVEVVAIVIEAIHPPPQAAAAYHAVQAAQIRAQIAVADQTGQAADSRSLAQETAAYDLDMANSDAAAAVAAARSDAMLFAGDRGAYQEGGQAFLLERWFGDLSGALGGTELLIIDHRLSGQAAPTIDLRPPMPPQETLPTQASPSSQAEPN